MCLFVEQGVARKESSCTVYIPRFISPKTFLKNIYRTIKKLMYGYVQTSLDPYLEFYLTTPELNTTKSGFGVNPSPPLWKKSIISFFLMMNYYILLIFSFKLRVKTNQTTLLLYDLESLVNTQKLSASQAIIP